ncbi:DAR GTPase 2, mitochondrial isoform X2 [Malania oleifera]|uniref:DAR GTPase 2, mitochondrial isoform X2 n=1 Tax=Malania oleifera TaxID=397392 RepID=UPI0025ADBA00|nr:DAR GTPase 2, mitochondrial isoform X2 [Malania oleifera]
MGTASIATRVGAAVKKAAANTGSGWFGPHMAAASRAIAERIPLVDLVLEIRDAREWMKYFDQQNCISYGVNSHNKENIKQFLNFLQGQVREMKKFDHSGYTTTIMLLGIPNVGKSALANSLHQIGRISAAEKGKLKHAIVSPLPGETKNISSLKIGSHPNIYVLDTPGILPREILDVDVCSKLALTGAIRDCLIGERELAQYFLAVLNLNDEYKKWSKLSTSQNDRLFEVHKTDGFGATDSDIKWKKQYPTDHTQDFIVNDVRQALYQTISSFDGNLGDERDLQRLIETQFIALQEAFRVPIELGENACSKVATKLINLYRTGRLGHYSLDRLPGNVQ